MAKTSCFDLDKLMATLNTDNPVEIFNAIRYVEQCKETAVPELLAAIPVQPDLVQRRIVGLLSGYSEENHDARLVESMLALLISPDPIIAGRAFDVLEGFITDIWPNLLALLPQCGSLIKLQLLQALNNVYDLRLISPLLQLLRETNCSSMRYTIIELLGKLASPGASEVIEIIETYADDPDHHVRTRVKRALDRLNATPLP